MVKSTTENFDILFPDVREQESDRLRQCQAVMLRMLKIFDFLCRKHNIEYFLTGGTLLGAIRHKGFIPWDDDLDIGMKRKDYNRFVRLAAHELPYDIFFQNTKTDSFFPMYHIAEAKLRDKYSQYVRKPEIDAKHRWHNGIQIDIFIYDRAFLPSNTALYYTNHFFRKLFGKFRKVNIRAMVLQTIEKLSPVKMVYASSYILGRHMIKFGDSWKTEEELKQLVRVPFEDMEALVPAGWHTYLQRMYGDYMTPPPKEKQRGVHGIEVADPFTPCNHPEILYWHERKTAAQKVAG